MVGMGAFRLGIAHRLDRVDPAAWDGCAGPDNPFVSHAFLSALEDSGSATAESGWAPHHLLLHDDGSDRLVGALPLYLKSHSQGEYVFDHGWANALQQAGGRYYPKLQSCVPFTPATGPRFLAHAAEDREAVIAGLARSAIQLTRDNSISSFHVTFPTSEEAALAPGLGLLHRLGEQYHWDNHGYATFDDFLEALNSRKRKMIRRERREAVGPGIDILRLTGDDLTDEHWDAFFAFYMDTGSRKWGRPYLTRAFFTLLHQRLRHRVMLVMARRAGRWIAGALNLIGADALYGRNWGCIEQHPFLHFECCYYQAIDFAIERGLKRVEAGAQGEHKIQRGYVPRPTHSLHYITEPSFRRAVERFLTQEREAVTQEIEHLGQYLPFRHKPEDEDPE